MSEIDLICDLCGEPFIPEEGCVIKPVDGSEECNPHMSMIYICAACNLGESDE